MTLFSNPLTPDAEKKLLSVNFTNFKRTKMFEISLNEYAI